MRNYDLTQRIICTSGQFVCQEPNQGSTGGNTGSTGGNTESTGGNTESTGGNTGSTGKSKGNTVIWLSSFQNPDSDGFFP